MATQHITVNGVNSFESGFDVNPSTLLDRAADGETSTTFQNTSGNQALQFELQGVSDYAVLSGATITSVQAVITVAASGKGSASFNVRLTDGTEEESEVYQADDLSSSNSSQTDVSGTTTNNGGSGFSADELNGMFLLLTGTSGALNIVSRVRALVTFTAATIVNPGFSLSNAYLAINGEMNLDSGQINLN